MGGDAPAPPPQESSRQMWEAFNEAFPEILRTVNEGVSPAAQAQLKANQETAPGLAKLQAELYDAFGPLMAGTANRIAADQAKSQSQSDLDIIKGTGRDLVKEGIETQKLADPEFYKSRETVSNRLGDLLGSIDLTGGISAGEQEALRRGIAQENNARGIAQTPSQTAVVEGAVKFGGAQRAREDAAKGQLTQALSVANGALPAMRSGVDAFQVATGRSSMPNAGDNKFTGVDTSLGSSANGLGANTLGQVSSIVQQRNDINSKRRDGLDRFNETFSSVVGSL